MVNGSKIILRLNKLLEIIDQIDFYGKGNYI
jgi:hypothetical protein